MNLRAALPLTHRPRRLRASAALRALSREAAPPRAEDLILPLFVSERITAPQPIASMPGVAQLPLSALVDHAAAAHAEDGIPAVLLFGIPREKDAHGTGAWADDGIIQQATRELKRVAPDLLVITDVCLCEYTDHGHCGVIHTGEGGHFQVANDESVALLARAAVSHAAAGADLVAPSDMMDGRVGAIRAALDAAGFTDTPVVSYAAKFASAFYGPFRDAAEGAPRFGDRRTYQMDPANAREALREVAADLEEAADAVIVKPGLPYLDILWRVKERFGVPTFVYNVSGEYAMLKAAAANGWLDERTAVLELLTAFRRAGADRVITYWARDAARWLREG